jgi:hypothetical protein
MICNHGLVFRDISRSFLPHQHSRITVSFWYRQLHKIKGKKGTCFWKGFKPSYTFRKNFVLIREDKFCAFTGVKKIISLDMASNTK